MINKIDSYQYSAGASIIDKKIRSKKEVKLLKEMVKKAIKNYKLEYEAK